MGLLLLQGGASENVLDSIAWNSNWDASREDSLSHVLGDVSAIADLGSNDYEMLCYTTSGAVLPITGVRQSPSGLNVLDLSAPVIYAAVGITVVPQPFTIFWAGAIDSTANSPFLFQSVGGGGGVAIKFNAGNSLQGGTGTIADIGSTRPRSLVCCCEFNGANSKTTVISGNGTQTATTTTPVTLGIYHYIANANTIGRLDGAFGQCAIKNESLDADLVSALLTALAAKWGVS